MIERLRYARVKPGLGQPLAAQRLLDKQMKLSARQGG
jgi:hypothetical protein